VIVALEELSDGIVALLEETVTVAAAVLELLELLLDPLLELELPWND
jgi:hypothetical protein